MGDLLKKLELKGYVTRTPSEEDKQLGFENLFDCLSEYEQTKLGERLEFIINDWHGYMAKMNTTLDSGIW